MQRIHCIQARRCLLFGVMCIIAPTSNAAPFCEEITATLKEASGFFSSWKGAAAQTTGVFDTSKRLPNARECFIVITDDRSSASYVCQWASETPKKGQEEFERLFAGLKACFPSATTYPSKSRPYASFDMGNNQRLQIEFNRSDIVVELAVTQDR